MRLKDKRCVVCGTPCTGNTCKECYHTKNNKVAGRYKLRKKNVLETELEFKGQKNTLVVKIYRNDYD